MTVGDSSRKLQRLSTATLPRLHVACARPAYDPTRHGSGIVHLGVGAFHRAHQAVYTDTVLAEHGGDWRICGVSLRSNTSAEQLNPQGGLYTVASKDEDACEYRVIGAIERVIAAVGDSRAAIEQMMSPQTHVVSLTITEKGYCRDATTGRLVPEHPDIVADMQKPGSPSSAIGCIVEALRLRRNNGHAPFTVLSCDNLPGNGATVRQVVVDFAALLDDKLANWIEHNAAFPATMVDRICPATTKYDRLEAARVLGAEDQGLVVAEPFSQWVIEDQFCDGRPSWEEAGAEIVADVSPYETAKLRLLNGSHSAIAFLGALGGIQYVHEAISDPLIARLIPKLMNEVESTLRLPGGFDVAQYRDSLLARFHNSALGYRTSQVAMDSSQKIPQRLIAPAIERLERGQSIDNIALAIGAWIRFVTSEDESGKRRATDDPLSTQLACLPSSTSNDATDVVDAVLSLSEVFDSNAATNNDFRNALVAALSSLVAR